jgi:hypothetical protein
LCIWIYSYSSLCSSICYCAVHTVVSESLCIYRVIHVACSRTRVFWCGFFYGFSGLYFFLVMQCDISAFLSSNVFCWVKFCSLLQIEANLCVAFQNSWVTNLYWQEFKDCSLLINVLLELCIKEDILKSFIGQCFLEINEWFRTFRVLGFLCFA